MKPIFRISILGLFLTVFLLGCGSDDPTDIFEQSTISLEASSSTVDESGMVTVTLTLATSVSFDVTAPIAYSGTATEGDDYTGPSTVVISSGETSGNFAISITDDSDAEESETIIVTIGSNSLPTGISLGSDATVTITIEDNDDAGFDIGDDECPNDNSTNQDNWDCDRSPSVASEYTESVSGDVRTIVTNGIPQHDYRAQLRGITDLSSTEETYRLDATPSLASSSSSITEDGAPAYTFGVAVNGVPIDPAPAEPFIFENTETGEYNWDWVFEPNNNMEDVGLDCNVSHLQPNNTSNTGTIHYHGLIVDLPNRLLAGLGSGTTTPTSPVQVGWAADGYPILYRFGPDASGNLTELDPSYQLKDGNRPGDGVSEPCGSYNGKYTNDYEFISGAGDLDECNGISQSVTLDGETFDYFYVITVDFPVISRCISGTPGDDFRKGGM